MEIERKFLLDAVPEEAASVPSSRMRQGYLSTGAEGEVRVRDTDGVFTLTVKSGAGWVREETEVPLTGEQFEALWPATEGLRLVKRRYRLPAGALIYEVDVYEGALAGLVVAEVEFPGLAAAERFSPPAWFGREIGDDVRYKNAVLAAHGLPDRGGDGYPLS